jgi:hypothetical protein
MLRIAASVRWRSNAYRVDRPPRLDEHDVDASQDTRHIDRTWFIVVHQGDEDDVSSAIM